MLRLWAALQFWLASCLRGCLFGQLLMPSISIGRARSLNDSPGAVTQLGDTNETVRLGAIFSLQRIARDSGPDHWPVVELLAAFVRDKSPVGRSREVGVPPAQDVQAAIFAIGQRARWAEDLAAGRRVNLENVDFKRVQLSGGHFEGAVLWGGDFRGADLRGTLLDGAQLQGAQFSEARLTGASLRCADLNLADLRGVGILDAVRLEGADVRTPFIEAFQLEGAFVDVNTKVSEPVQPGMMAVAVMTASYACAAWDAPRSLAP